MKKTHAFLLACLLGTAVSLSAHAVDVDDVDADPDVDCPGEEQNELINDMIEDLQEQARSPEKPHRYVLADGTGHLVGIINARYITVETDKPEIYLSDIVNIPKVPKLEQHPDENIVDLPANAIRIGAAH